MSIENQTINPEMGDERDAVPEEDTPTDTNEEPEMSEEEIIELAKTGDKKAIETLYKKYNADLVNFIKTKTKSLPEAEDIVQNTWKKILEHIGDLKGNNFKTWALTIAHRNFLRGYRYKKMIDKNIQKFGETMHPGIDQKNLDHPADKIEKDIDEKKLKKVIDEAINSFDKNKQTIIRKRREGKTFVKIAQEQGDAEVEKIESIWYRTKDKLKKILKSKGITKDVLKK